LPGCRTHLTARPTILSFAGTLFVFVAIMPSVPGLRSPYSKVGPLVYFGRVLDKIRLHAAGKLPADYIANLGKALDGRCMAFLGVDYEDLKARTLAADLTDEQILAWCHARGGPRTEEQFEVWNGFMMKRGWRDAGAGILAKRIAESKLEGKPITTMFDYLDFDEDRDPIAVRAWEQ
jgi:gluconokinase